MKDELTARDFAVLQKNRLFQGLSGETLQYALDFFSAVPKRYEKGEFLHRVGSRMTRFGLVLSGRVQVHMDDIDGNPIIMANVTEGNTFGESMCFLEIEEEPVTICAATGVKVLWLSTEEIKRMPGGGTGNSHSLTLRFITLLTEKTLAMNDRIQILSKKSLRGKLIVFFSQCAHQYGSDTFTLPFNRNEMAAYLGADRSALSRELAKMQEEGILQFYKEKFRLMKRTEED
ncbi:Crp/Fnr family transcriptional regulator [Qiania dongpingensis]|uniref:Crp/Fnr family transcriptional regulator n=1 Tax=Qiania dongpingensis TaxID=2763669 RepID=A0A7G9G3L0_9FIRM|nr:Crp/Fnr family transcriptional regulator [Qiania dongpingensis]QNM05392.1 Crp/Fnr family transcriptional regulator [Qiania dongpingensis]